MRYHSNNQRTRLIKRAGVTVSALFVAGMLAACGDNTTVGQTEPTTAPLPTVESTSVVGLEPTVEGNPPVNAADTPMAQDTPMAEGTPMTDTTPMAEGTPMTDTTPMAEGNGATDTPLTVAELMQNPSAYVGQTVTVVGEVENVYGNNGFKLDEDSWLTAGIDNDLPVIGSSADVVNNVADTWINDQYLVTGTVVQYVQVDFERDYNWFTPGDQWNADVEENDTVLVADSAQPVDANTYNPGLGAADNNGTFGDNVPAGTLAVADVTGSMDQYAGQQVTVQGEVQNVYNGPDNNGQALRLDDNSLLTGGIDNDLLVIGAGADTLANAQGVDEFGFDNTIVRVTGTVQQFNRSDIESTIGYSLTDPIFDGWDGQPVLVADSIEVVGQQ